MASTRAPRQTRRRRNPILYVHECGKPRVPPSDPAPFEISLSWLFDSSLKALRGAIPTVKMWLAPASIRVQCLQPLPRHLTRAERDHIAITRFFCSRRKMIGHTYDFDVSVEEQLSLISESEKTLKALMDEIQLKLNILRLIMIVLIVWRRCDEGICSRNTCLQLDNDLGGVDDAIFPLLQGLSRTDPEFRARLVGGFDVAW